MPELEKLEQFNKDLIQQGNEPAHAARRGEEIEKPLTPEEYPLNNRPTGVKVNRAAQAPGGPAAPAVPDTSTDDFLSSLGDDLFTPSSGTTGDAPAAEGGGDAGTSPDFADLFDDDLLSGLPKGPEEEAPAGEEAPDLRADLPGPDDGVSDLDVPDTSGAGILSGEEETGGGFSLDLDDGGLDILGDLAGLSDDAGNGEAQDSADGGLPPLADLSDTDESAPGGLEATDQDAGGESDFLADFSDDFIHNQAAGDGVSEEGIPGEASFDLPDFDADAMGNDIPGTEDFSGVTDEVPDADMTGGNSEVPDALPGDEDLDFALPEFDDEFSSPGEDMPVAEAADDAADLNEFQMASQSFEPPAEPAPAAGTDSTPEAPGDFASGMDMDFDADSFSDEFDMSDFGKDFGLMEEVHQEAWTAPEAPQTAKDGGGDGDIVSQAEEEIQKATLHEQAESWQISPEDLRRVQETLGAMPLNLKVATEDILGNPDTDFDNLRNLVNVLIRGESPQDIAPIVSRISGKKIRIPAGYTKRTGLAFEHEQKSFSYRFRKTVLPVIRLVALAALAFTVLAVGVYELLYRPLYGGFLYERGLEAIRQDQYDEGEDLFSRAYRLWPDNGRFVEYARTYQDRRQDRRASDKYEELLGMPNPRTKPFGKDRMHRQGLLAYGDFLAWTLRDHSTAITYVQRLVDKDKFDHDAVLLQGDVFLDWARYVDAGTPVRILRSVIASRERPGEVVEVQDEAGSGKDGISLLLEAARYNYASLISKEGQTDLLLSRMLLYFMRSGMHEEELAADAREGAALKHEAAVAAKEGEANRIKELFLGTTKTRPDPRVIAELSGYLIDAAEGNPGAMADARQLLENSMDNGRSTEPGIHYQLSRYFRTLRDKTQEKIALGNAIANFENLARSRPLDRFEEIQYVDALIRQGEVLYGPLYAGQEVVESQKTLEKARDLYERDLQTGRIPKPVGLLGRVYAQLGDILYYSANDLGGAWRQYQRARNHGFGEAPAELFPMERSGPRPFLNRSDAGIPRLSTRELQDASRDLSYKSGFIRYYEALNQEESGKRRELNLDLALQEFLVSSGSIPYQNVNLQYAIANTQYERDNQAAAVATYRQVLERLESDRENLPELHIYEKQAHRELVEFMVRVHNNLGVSLYKLYLQGGENGPLYRGEAMRQIGRAIEIFENASRDEESAVRAEYKSAAYLNLHNMLKERTENDLMIIPDLRRDLGRSVFSKDLMTVGQHSPRGQAVTP